MISKTSPKKFVSSDYETVHEDDSEQSYADQNISFQAKTSDSSSDYVTLKIDKETFKKSLGPAKGIEHSGREINQ